jgi:enamine deaminase RidA (YjgF/YER057c/UK114 family)
MAHTIHDIGVASQIGSYSDAIEAKPNLRWLMTSGTPGLAVNGDGLPKDITGQARPASMLLVIPQLVWPEILVEVEIIAAKA